MKSFDSSSSLEFPMSQDGGSGEGPFGSLLSTLVVLACLAIIACLVFPNAIRTRHHARANTCISNLRIIGHATHNYHSAFRKLPMAAGGTDGYGDEEKGNDHLLSGFVALLPFMEQQALWEKISNPYKVGGRVLPAMGPAPSYDPSIYPFWAHQVEQFVCPEETVTPSDFGIRSYVTCYGDGIENVGNCDKQEMRYVCRGLFARRHAFRFRDCLDGLSNTILISETAIGIGDAMAKANVAKDIDNLSAAPITAFGLRDRDNPAEFDPEHTIWLEGKGSRWADGSFRISGFNTVLPPNSPSCTAVDDPWSGLMSASSHHADGVHALMADGAVRFVFASIDAGDLSRTSVAKKYNNGGIESPYGVWGALGTRACKELIPPASEGNFVSATERVPTRENQKDSSTEKLEKRMERLETMMEKILKRLEQSE